MSYENFSVEKYNETISNLLSKRKQSIRNLFISSAITSLAFPNEPIINDMLDLVTHLFKFNWLIGIPVISQFNIGSNLIDANDLLLDPKVIQTRKNELKDKRIIYTLVTRGYNIHSVEDSTNSVLYWTKKVKEKYNLKFETEAWVVTEEDTYTARHEKYEKMREKGCKIITVPADYTTPKQTKFKARALHYATELRKDLGIDGKDDWIYHQDEETMVGEDTVCGNLDFIQNSQEKIVGQGIIIYPVNWSNSISAIEECVRSGDDLRFLLPIKTKGKLIGLHGSHNICRSDVENQIGWDFGKTRLEDSLFGLKLQQQYGNVAGIMKGFAYEKPPFSVKDQLKQRGRWILGWFEIIFKNKEISTKNKLIAFYHILSWYSAFPSLIGLVLNVVNPTGGIFPYSGALAGFIWYSMYETYKKGYEMNKEYFSNKPEDLKEKVKMCLNLMGGMITEAIAPWYTLVNRTHNFDNIQKDKHPTIQFDKKTRTQEYMNFTTLKDRKNKQTAFHVIDESCKPEDIVGLIALSDTSELDYVISTLEKRHHELLNSVVNEYYRRVVYSQIYDAMRKRYEGLRYWNEKGVLSEFEKNLMERLYNVMKEFYYNIYPQSFYFEI